MAKETTTEPTKDALLEEARALDVEGRSAMNKDELADAVAAAKGAEVSDADRVSIENAFRNASSV